MNFKSERSEWKRSAECSSTGYLAKSVGEHEDAQSYGVTFNAWSNIR